MATSFLWAPGATSSGLLTAAVTLQSTEMNSLGSAGVIISSVGGATGKFTNADTAQAIWAEMYLFLGAITGPLVAGANLAGWFLTSPDSGTSMELTTAAPARGPDFVVPVPAGAVSASSVIGYKAPGLVRLPSLQFKVLVQNNLGFTMAATANVLKLAPISVQY